MKKLFSVILALTLVLSLAACGGNAAQGTEDTTPAQELPASALEILETVWGKDYIGELKIVDVNIRRLRIKIEDDATKPKYITTVWGFGYKWGN